MNLSIRLLYFAFITFSTWSSFSQETSDAVNGEKLTKIEAKIQAWQKQTNAPAVSVAFQHHDFYYENAWGLADIENQVEAKPASSYQIASTTKPMTAMAILKLWEMGKIDLDAEVQTYYPYFPKKEYPVTIRQILSHTAGISHYRSDSKEEKHIKEPYSTTMAIDIFKDWELLFEPNTDWNYSSYGYNLLGAVIEEVSGKSYEDFLKEHIWIPANMENTMMDDPIAIVPNRVQGYFKNGGKIENGEYLDISSRFGAGGVRSTVQDVVKMGIALKNGKILKPETVELMLEPMGEQGWNEYALGISVRPFLGQHIIMHSGGMPQTSFLFIAAPADNISLSIGSNLGRQDVESLGISLVQILSGIDTKTVAAKKAEDKLMLDAINEVYNFGQGYYQKMGKTRVENDINLASDFKYFNRYINPKYIRDNSTEVREKIEAGHQIQPEKSLIWDRVGGYMASQLNQNYSQEGALAFFKAYIGLYKKDKSISYRFTKGFESAVEKYDQDWQVTKALDPSLTRFDENTDWDQVPILLDNELGEYSVYPDFYGDLIDYTYSELLFNKKYDEISEITSLADTYFSGRFFTEFLKGFEALSQKDLNKAKTCFSNANEIENHLENPNWIGSLILNLAQVDPVMAFGLGEVMATYNPKSYEFQIGLSNLARKMGMKEKSIFYAQKALEIKPDDETALKFIGS
ncbi:serine hydrolase domain-containing protein [Lutimonas zeaxanthinifaciens]|uniref:serine hydrolase domain-containing protein n=1 Tax=Lutimonas zeaxanthinifaciens TaxID=3060215 RepID=UPI00265CFEC8|nr:serine hydrolase domain-containing protein [Lutimonas sp. YSD2104]WKK65733.1 serine hydrolase domain-containing protein [Lutimonas sp. YSD2104]